VGRKHPKVTKDPGPQRMAGDVWKTHDANARGGSGFDMEDLNDLRSQGWSNNDIMKAAAKSGSVDAETDNELRGLNPSRAVENQPVIDGETYGRNRGSYKEIGRRIKDDLAASGNLRWNGTNADGSARSLSGYTGTGASQKEVSWSLPSDMVESQRQADFDRRFAARQAAEPQKAQPQVRANAMPNFDVRSFMAPSSVQDGTAGKIPSAFVADTKATAFDAFKARQDGNSTSSASTPYKPKVVGSDEAEAKERNPDQRWKRFWNPNSSTAGSIL